MTITTSDSARHILSLSGGKDSTALAIFMRDKLPNIEYVFCDTEKELPETYDYLKNLEVYLGKTITYLKHDGRGFDELLLARNGFLPSPQVRWCTELLKIKPFEYYIGDDFCFNYIGIRADEQHRKGYISSKPNIIAKYPFIENGIRKEDVTRILIESGLGFPNYYNWRSRSGCYFCFFQQRIEWIGLLENHPDLFESALNYEKIDKETGEGFFWSSKESLLEIKQPERIKEIKNEFELRMKHGIKNTHNLTLAQVFEIDTDVESCLICHL